MLITQLKKRPQRKSKAQTETGIFYFTTRSSGVKKLVKKDQSNKLQKIYNVKRDDLIKIYTNTGIIIIYIQKFTNMIHCVKGAKNI